MIKGLDDDEIEFLDMVDRTKLEADRKKEMEEERELNDYRNRVAILQEKSIEERLQAEIVVNKPKTQTTSRSSQQKLLKGVVIKKNEGSLKRKLSDSENNINSAESEAKQIKQSNEDIGRYGVINLISSKGLCLFQYISIKISYLQYILGDDSKISNDGENVIPTSGLKCVAILPGLGFYEDSSSDENSSDSEIEVSSIKKIDILGRKIEKKENDS